MQWAGVARPPLAHVWYALRQSQKRQVSTQKGSRPSPGTASVVLPGDPPTHSQKLTLEKYPRAPHILGTSTSSQGTGLQGK